MDANSSKTSVFLSYARADDDPDYDDPTKNFMRRLYHALTAAGFVVWWDRESLPSRGLAFTVEIEQAINTCERFVLVVAPGAIASSYVQKEWELALSVCKPTTPILRVGEYSLIPSPLADFNAIDFRTTRDESAAIDDLIARLREDAPMGKVLGSIKPLPKGHIIRKVPFNAAREAILADAIKPTVISAPPHATAVYGVGGIGKSTMAVALANNCDIRRKYPDGVIWVEIGQTPSIQTRLGDIGAALGDDLNNYIGQGTDEQSAGIRLSALLHDKRALIVLDDVWDHKLIVRFPVTGTPCRLLITTRSGKLARLVEGADIPLHTLTSDEGASLIARRAGGNETEPLYQEISILLGGHTLAIRLAADQLANHYADDAADLLRLLTKGENPFKHLKPVDDDKDENLELSLSLSYQALPNDDLRRRFRALGVFALESTFDRNLLATVWGDSDPDDTRQPLITLEGAGLIERSAETGRFVQHRLLRAYARALLNQKKEMQDVFGRYVDNVLEWLEKLNALPLERWNELNELIPHFHEIGDNLVDIWKASMLPDEDLIRRAGTFSWVSMIYLSYRREALFVNGEPKRLSWMTMGLDIWTKLGEQKYEAITLSNLGLTWDALGEKRKALKFHEHALTIFQTLNIQEHIASTLSNIGLVWLDLGEEEKSLEFYEQAVSIFRAIQDIGGEGTALDNMGLAWRALRDAQTAIWFHEHALPLRREANDRRGEAMTLNNLGLAWFIQEDMSKALNYYNQALRISQMVGDRLGEGATLNNIGLIWEVREEPLKALEFYKQSLSLRRLVGDKRGESETSMNIGMIYYRLNDFDQAVEYIKRCVQLDIEVEHPDLDSDRQVLELIKRRRDGGSELIEPDKALQFLADIYTQSGADSVRVFLKNTNLSGEAIEALIAQLAGGKLSLDSD